MAESTSPADTFNSSIYDSPSRVVVVTACSLDYLAGRLCIPANEAWATRHGYAFRSVVLPTEDMLAAIRPRDHLTWYKVLLINELLADPHWEWVLWIDADAVVVRPEMTVMDLAMRGKYSKNMATAASSEPTHARIDEDRADGGGAATAATGAAAADDRGDVDGAGAGGGVGGGSTVDDGWHYCNGTRNGHYKSDGAVSGGGSGGYNSGGGAFHGTDGDKAGDVVPHLVVGEDLTPTCKINAGVMLIRGSEWSRRVWVDVWACQRWRTKPFHEQSSLIRWLKVNEPGFASAVPWHSWDGASDDGHRTKHTLVLPHSAINTNGGSTAHQKRKGMPKIERLASIPDQQPRFAFHAVGCSPKCAAIRTEMDKWGVVTSLTDAEISLMNPRVMGGSGAPLDDDGVAVLAATIMRENPEHLTYLALNRNSLGPTAAIHVHSILTSKTPVRVLDLSHNETLGDDGVEGILKAVAESRTLVSLYLERVGITERAARIAAAVMSRHVTLRFLDLSGNTLSHDGMTDDSLSSDDTSVSAQSTVLASADGLTQSPGTTIAGAMQHVGLDVSTSQRDQGHPRGNGVAASQPMQGVASQPEHTNPPGDDYVPVSPSEPSSCLGDAIIAALLARGTVDLTRESVRKQRPFPTRCVRGSLRSGEAIEILW